MSGNGQVVTETVLDLPPLETDVGLVRLAVVLSNLCHCAYANKASDIGTASHIEVPLMTPLHTTFAVEARLLHFRHCSGPCPVSGCPHALVTQGHGEGKLQSRLWLISIACRAYLSCTVCATVKKYRGQARLWPRHRGT